MSRVRPSGDGAARRRKDRARQEAFKPSATPDSANGIRWRTAVIAIVSVVTYSNSLSVPFLLDDKLSVVANGEIRQWWNLARVLLPERDTSVAGRPLVNLSFAINYAIGGLEVRGYHVWNIAVHLMCALLVFGIVRRTLELPRLSSHVGTRSVGLAFAVALIWALHPLNSEVVDYLTQRTESMMAFCYLLTLYGSQRAVRSARPMAAWQALALVSCAAGMACKETIVTAPLMVVLYDRSMSSIR
jgi:hypothetical protein